MDTKDNPRLIVILDPQVIDFLKRCDLGFDKRGTLIKDKLYFINENDPMYGITDLITIYTILKIYSKVNNLHKLSAYNQDLYRQIEPEYKDPTIISADDLMMECLGPYFKKIVKRSQSKLKSLGVTDKQQKPQREKCRHKRHYFHDIITLSDGRKDIGNKHEGNKHEIWNDFYHVFDPYNFHILELITLSKLGSHKLRVKPTKEIKDKIKKLYQVIKKDMIDINHNN